MQIPILTYHSLNTTGQRYETNDHIALERDLETLKASGFRVERLATLVEAFNRGDLAKYTGQRVCALTFDDGVTHDYIDYYHPARGLLKSFARILAEASESSMPDWQAVQATSFVIVSPEARATLDIQCIQGADQWHDHWWVEAVSSKQFDICNHSWDHTHPELPKVAQRDQVRGNFFCIDNRVDAYHQIQDAEAYLSRKLGDARPRLFAYPYGHVSDYLKDEFFPEHSEQFAAAFSTAGDYLSEDSNRWALPRFVCGHHWRTPDEFESILRGAESAGPKRDEGRIVVSSTPQHTGQSADSGDDRFGSPSTAFELEGAVSLTSGYSSEQGKQPSSTEPFFIVGSVRSGTTLLRNLLRQQATLHCPEETHFFRWPDPFGSPDYEITLRENATLKQHRIIDGVSEEEFLTLLTRAGGRDELQDGYAELFLKARGVSGGRWFDKTPQNIYGLLLLSALYKNSQFINLVRHPFNVVASLKAGRVLAKHGVQGAINTWLEAELIARQFRSAWPERMHTITYETLTTSPATTMEEITRFLNVDADERAWNFEAVHPERNLYEQQLTSEEVTIIKNQLEPYMAVYGYQ